MELTQLVNKMSEAFTLPLIYPIPTVIAFPQWRTPGHKLSSGFLWLTLGDPTGKASFVLSNVSHLPHRVQGSEPEASLVVAVCTMRQALGWHPAHLSTFTL